MSGYYGLYKGICVNNEDPEGLYRITAIVPQVFGDASIISSWAWPCLPLLSGGAFTLAVTGGTFILSDPTVSSTPSGTLVGTMPTVRGGVPLVGAGVWIGFEGGDENYPYWSGVWLTEAPT